MAVNNMKKVVAKPFPAPLLTSPSDFGLAVRAARTSVNLTMADAALAIGIARQTLQDIEKGVGTVGIGLCLKVAQQLGVSLFCAPASDRQKVALAIESACSSEREVERLDRSERPRS